MNVSPVAVKFFTRLDHCGRETEFAERPTPGVYRKRRPISPIIHCKVCGVLAFSPQSVGWLSFAMNR